MCLSVEKHRLRELYQPLLMPETAATDPNIVKRPRRRIFQLSTGAPLSHGDNGAAKDIPLLRDIQGL
jgi:hypothetical protein